MVVCPNKSSKEWQSLAKELGTDRAMLAFIRNGNDIPTIEKARELITNKGMLENLQMLPKLSEESVLQTLKTNNLITGEPYTEDGKIYYQLNPNVINIGDKLAEFTSTYGTVLKYKGSDYVTINPDSIAKWNSIAAAQRIQNNTATGLAKDFLDRIGVKVTEQDDVIKRFGANGVADFAERMVRIQSGMMDEALPEEALHFFLDMIPQDHPALLEALDKIRSTPIYKQTLEQYKNNPNYRIDGQINFSKIKKEALAKQLAAEMKENEKRGWIESAIKAIIDWIMSLGIQKSPNQVLRELYYSKDMSLLNTNLTSSEIYNQLNDDIKAYYEAQDGNEKQKDTLKNILTYIAPTHFDDETHTYTYAKNPDGAIIRSVTKVLGSDFYSELDNPDVITALLDGYMSLGDKSLSDKDRAKQIVDFLINDIYSGTKDEKQLTAVLGERISGIVMTAAMSKAKTLFGTAVHSIAEHIVLDKPINLEVKSETNPDGIDPNLFRIMDKEMLNKLVYGNAREAGLVQTIRDLRNSGHMIMTEVPVSNGKLGGVLDVVAIDKDGVAHIYDYKTKFIKNFGDKTYIKKDLIDEFHNTINTTNPIGIKDDPDTLKALVGTQRNNRQKYTQQMSIYKKLLMEAGIPVGSLNIIGIPYRLGAESKKVSDIKIEMIKNVPFDNKIGNYYFGELDPELDASAKKEIKFKEDSNLEIIKKIEKNKLKEGFAKALSRLTQIFRSFDNKRDKEDQLYNLLNNTGTKTNKVQVQKSQVESVLKNFEGISNMIDVQKNFLELIDSSAPIIKAAIEHFNVLKSTTPTNDNGGTSQRLSELLKVKDFLVGYQNMFEDILESLDDAEPGNAVKEKLTGMVGAITNVRNEYISTITPDLVNVLGDVFNKDLLDNIKREYNELIAAARVRGDKEREKTLMEERDNLPSQKVIEELLKGNKGDVGWFFGKLVATISNPDIILAGVAKKLKATLDRVRIQNKEFRDELSVELNKRFAAYGRNMSVKENNQALTYIVEEFDPNTDKKEKTRNVMYFKSEFDEKIYSDYNKLKYAFKEAEKSQDKDAITKAKKDMKDFENKYFQTGFTEEYYRLTEPLNRKVMYGGVEKTVKEIENGIRDQIANLERQYSNDDLETGAFHKEHLDELQKLNEQKAELRDLLDSNGNRKTGDALKIAEALNEYDKNKEKLYETEEQTEYYNRVQQKAKLEYGEDSEEYKKWLSENTRLVIKDEYYTQMAALVTEKGELLGALGTSEELNNLYKKLRDLTSPYRDKDGFIRGAMMSEDVAKKIKDTQDQINDMQQNMEYSLYNGYTRAEKAELDNLWYLKRNDLPYNQRRIDELQSIGKSRLAARIAADPTLEEKIERVKEINSKIFAMSKKGNTKYYYRELENQKKNFADANDISVNQLEEEGTWLEQFKQTEWYQKNHIIKTTVLFEDEETGERREATTEVPTYQWRRNMPVEEYIETKPGRQFNRVKLKESYVNDKGETVMLQDPDNLDVQGRYKPKTNEQYRHENGGKEHPYLNQEFAELKRKNENGSASIKEKADYENLLYIHDKMLKSQEGIEMSQRLGLAVPFLEKELFERTVETKGENVAKGTKGFFSNIWTAIKRAVTRTDQDVDQNGIPNKDEDIRGNTSKLATMDNNQVKHIPVRFSTKGEAENASYDVWGGVLSYIASINRKSELEKELAFVNGVEQVLGAEQNQPKSKDNNLILNNIYKRYLGPEFEAKINAGGNTRLEVLKSFLNSVMYNEEFFQGFDVFGVNTQKAIGNVMGLTSFAILGAAPFNWAVNLISGNIQNFVEGAGGRIFNVKDFVSANADLYTGGKYGSPIKDMQEDYVKVGNRSFWGQIMEVFDPLQGEFENEYGHKTSWNAAKNIFQLGMFAGKVWGEWEIQMKTFIAFMKNHKLYNGEVVDKETFITKKIGTDLDSMTPSQISNLKYEALQEWDKLDVNLLDMMELKDGKLAIKDQYKSSFEFGSSQFSDIVAKLHAMQKKLNGAYNKFDKTYAEKTSIGRMMYFFRKYFIPIGMARWGQRRVDYESMSVEQGFYLTFLQTAGKDLLHLKLNVVKNWHNYSDQEKRAIVKTLTDIGIVLTIMAAYSILLGFNPDDKDRFKKLEEKGWAAQAAVFLLLRVKSETEQFLPYAGINEIQGVYSNPSLIFSQTTQYINITRLLLEHVANTLPGVDFNHDLYYQKDAGGGGLKDKGDSKAIAALAKMLGYSGRTAHPIDAIKSWEFIQRQNNR
jgi:hypothetical protein